MQFKSGWEDGNFTEEEQLNFKIGPYKQERNPEWLLIQLFLIQQLISRLSRCNCVTLADRNVHYDFVPPHLATTLNRQQDSNYQ